MNDDWIELVVDGEVVLEGRALSVHEAIKIVLNHHNLPEATHRSLARCIYCEKEIDLRAKNYVCTECSVERIRYEE